MSTILRLYLASCIYHLIGIYDVFLRIAYIEIVWGLPSAPHSNPNCYSNGHDRQGCHKVFRHPCWLYLQIKNVLQAPHVVGKIRVRTHQGCVEKFEVFQLLRQIFDLRHLRIVDQDWHDRHLFLFIQRRENFNQDKIQIFSFAFSKQIEPIFSDNDQHDVALVDRSFDVLTKIPTKWDRIDIFEHVGFAVTVGKLLINPVRNILTICPSIRDKYLPHRFSPK